MTNATQLDRPGLAHGVGRLLVLCALLMCAIAAAPQSRASASNTICVALVVDFTPLNGSVDSACTRVPPGATGYDVLRAGGHSYGICSNGIIGTIDGQPANGCQIKDNTHFWGYWHRKPGSTTWSFSSYGAGYYHPVEGSTDGWVWENGTTSPPANVPYPSGCHTPPASPTPASSPMPRKTSPAGQGTSSPAVTSAPRSSTNGGRGTTADATKQPTAGRHHHAATPAAAKTSAAPGPPTPSPSPTASTPAVVEPAATGAGGSRHHAVPALGGIAGAALLGAGAWWRARRSGGGS